MEIDRLYSELTPIFREVFDNDALTLTPELSAADVAEWDSLSHVRLIVTVEEHFNLKFSLAKVAELKNVGEFVTLIKGML